MSNRIVVTGGRGFIGKALCRQLVADGFEVVVLGRQRGEAAHPHTCGSFAAWDGKTAQGWASHAEGALAIINLAGENIGSGVWTRAKRQAILQSRLDAGHAVVAAVEMAQKKPEVVVQASAIGYYGNRGDELLDESSSGGRGFLADVAQQWERSTQAVGACGVRHVVVRMAVVLGHGGGVMARVTPTFRFFMGGHFGDGQQWFSWVHIRDAVDALRFLVRKAEVRGVFNVTAPHPVLSREFYHLLGKVMRRPSFLSVPGFPLRLVLGEMAQELILSSQRVTPRHLHETGYEFHYPQVETALREILIRTGT
jgi:uncharacterized protein